MHLILNFGLLSGTLWGLSKLLTKFHIKTTKTIFLVALVFTLLAWGLGWLVKVVLFLPAILTLGLLFFFFPFLVNTFILWMTDKLLDDFELGDTKTLLISSGAITLVNFAMHQALRHLH